MKDKIANIQTTKYLLNKYELLAKKSLGQNFIVDSNIIDRLISHAKLSKDVAVIEVGPGLGSLTQELINHAGKVVSIEIDQNMVKILNDLFKEKENFKLIHSDILDFDLESLVKELKNEYKEVVIVANLPYYITSEILIKLFKLEDKVDTVMLMVQREFAQRLTAQKSSKDYRTLTVLAQTFYKSKTIMRISKHVFYPRPNVDSAIILMKAKDSQVSNLQVYADFIAMCFTQKRKTIYNNLRSALGEDLAKLVLEKSGIVASQRAADLDLSEFLKMYEVYYEEKSFAKVNLSLDVVRKRADGYHELDMIMVPIDLFDTISIKISEKMEMTTNKGYIPIDDKNTVIKAINLLRDKYNFSENFKIKLVKNTPTQGGLGGGSSNAATTISMIDEILDLKMTLDDMLEIGEKVGADVPFCVFGKPARVSGFGEVIKPIDYNLDFFMFIVKPKWGVSTPKAFSKLDLSNIKHPDINLVESALKNDDYNTFVGSIDNSLEDGAVKIVPKIKKIKKDLIKFGFDTAVMSGSGSTVFAITKDEDLIDRAVSKFVRKYHFVKKTRVIKDIRDEENI